VSRLAPFPTGSRLPARWNQPAVPPSSHNFPPLFPATGGKARWAPNHCWAAMGQATVEPNWTVEFSVFNLIYFKQNSILNEIWFKPNRFRFELWNLIKLHLRLFSKFKFWFKICKFNLILLNSFIVTHNRVKSFETHRKLNKLDKILISIPLFEFKLN
jgi:hypothetical protein